MMISEATGRNHFSLSSQNTDKRVNPISVIKTQKGFSLIELIVTVILIAVFGSMIIVFFGTSIIKSSDPVSQFKKTTELHTVMQNITADYQRYPKWKASTSYALNTVVVPVNVNGRSYRCIQAGTSGLSEPNWPFTTAGTVNDNTVVWQENGKVHDANSLTVLSGKIGAEGTSQNNSYGKYTVDKKIFIKFDAATGSEISGTANDILKVTIKNDIGETLTGLFIADHLI